ncbi:NEAT domain-containing protein [Clostridium botulinum]|uniref:NEAT domain-containing protein n=1 Tax=Clostridium botulinum TaxID=1491 RepID=UPI000174E56D|nr:NEAT domain-containing protein [Clostridium botulinum]ACD52145.1 iron transport-associated domain protein [Clostridium botulinum E3 str. Alaska E43]MBY6787901.1 NEAT domain-containing protein [Clostridium botulinum]MBY6815542.1 NEAT domain-containing protein [Clostridium botulinum]MBY6828203.1 NEAT domain-containing protein [Clostridium botulinum]MBY6860150.1 NEAT domain-containing protein [Clostridium botulinum]
MKNRIISFMLALIVVFGFVPKVSAAELVEDNIISLRDLVDLDKSDSIFSIEGIKSTTSAQITIENDKELIEDDLELNLNDNLENGVYLINYNAYKDGTTEDSSAGKYIEESKLKVKNGKKTVLVTFKDEKSWISNLSAKVNDDKVKVTQTEVVDSKFTIEFPIDSLEDNISIGLTIMGFMNHSFDFIINDVTFMEPIEDDNTTDSEVLKDGKYTIDADILKTGTNEPSAASGYINKESNLKSENGQYTLTLNVKDIKVMSNIKATVDGKEVNVNISRNNDGTGEISFKINTLSSDILIACKVTVAEINYNSDVDFNVKLDKSTLKNDDGAIIQPPTEDVELPLYKDASYKIENEVLILGDIIPESVKYLDNNSIIDVQNQSIYLTLTFNMADFMSNREVKLNDNNGITRYTIVSNTNNKTVIKFKISSLNDEIHISSKTRSLDKGFTLSLLKETLSEKTNDTGNSSDKEEETDKEDSEDDDLEDGTYTIKNKALKENSNATSDARGYLDDVSIVTVKNGKIYLTLKFTHGKMMSDISIKVEDKKTSYTTVKKSGNNLHIKFKIGSLSDEILVTSTIDTGIPAIGTIKGTKFRVLLRESTLDEDDEQDDEEDIEEDTEDKVEDTNKEDTIINNPENNITGGEIDNNISQSNPTLSGNSNSYKKATYKVNNEIVTDSQIGYQAARSAVNKSSYYEIENDSDHYITLGFTQTDVMGNIRLTIDGSKINYDIVNEDKSKKTMEIRFKVPSLSNQVVVTSNITAMGRDISFGIKFLESTLELISLEESETNIPSSIIAGTLTGTLSGANNNSNGNFFGTTLQSVSDNNSSVGGDSARTLVDNNMISEAKEYFKRYTVNNEVLSNSTIGRTMARKYLNETSIIEEIDGKLYATVTFNSSNSMGNFKIKVNGEDIEHSIVLNDKSNELISLRFPINNINDDIRTYIYIKPMKMTIDFGIKFLGDTMILIDEGTINEEKDIKLVENLATINEGSSNNKNISVWKIAITTSIMTTTMNFAIAGIIYIIVKKRKKKLNKNINS